MNLKKIAVIGAGGCGRDVAWTIRETLSTHYEFAGFIVTDLRKPGRFDSKDEILGDLDWLEEKRDSITALAVGIGTPAIRQRVVAEVLQRFPGMEWPAVIHPTVSYEKSTAEIARGVVVCAGVVATVNVRMDEFAMVHYGATVAHESHIGQFTVVNPGANISGGVILGDAVLVGAGSVILQYLTVGSGAIVGAGAVVTKDIPANEVWAGIPAAPVSRS